MNFDCKSEFITIIPIKNDRLSLQFADNWLFIRLLKEKIPAKFRELSSKEKHHDSLYATELERIIYYFNINKRYWKWICKDLEKFFRKVYVVKNGKTYQSINGKAKRIKGKINDKNKYENDYEKKKYKIYRDR